MSLREILSQSSVGDIIDDVVMMEQLGQDADELPVKCLPDLLCQSEKLKRSLRNICDVKTLDERGQVSSASQIEYYCLNEPKMLEFCRQKFLRVQQHLAANYVKANEQLLKRLELRNKLMEVKSEVKAEPEVAIKVEDYLAKFETEAAGFVVDELP